MDKIAAIDGALKDMPVVESLGDGCVKVHEGKLKYFYTLHDNTIKEALEFHRRALETKTNIRNILSKFYSAEKWGFEECLKQLGLGEGN